LYFLAALLALLWHPASQFLPDIHNEYLEALAIIMSVMLLPSGL
jgi:hypothetical protein